MPISFCKRNNTEQLIKYIDFEPFHRTCAEIVVKLNILAVDLKGK